MPKPKKVKRRLSPAQRLAIKRRSSERETRDKLKDIEELLYDSEHIPENCRRKVASALCCLLRMGHLFPIACGKAAAGISITRDREAFWRFIDEQNALFRSRVDAETVARWDAPDYDVPEKKGEAA